MEYSNERVLAGCLKQPLHVYPIGSTLNRSKGIVHGNNNFITLKSRSRIILKRYHYLESPEKKHGDLSFDVKKSLKAGSQYVPRLCDAM